MGRGSQPLGDGALNFKYHPVHLNRNVWEPVRLLEDVEAYERTARAVNPYGDGHAAEQIVGALLN